VVLTLNTFVITPLCTEARQVCQNFQYILQQAGFNGDFVKSKIVQMFIYRMRRKQN
jgi:enamine deaminase RidA (YjgF/YER057c/UK114 family)